MSTGLRSRAAAASAAALAALALPLATTAQTVSLGAPNAALSEDFGAIQTVRELPDGRVLVADPLGRALYAVDLDAGRRTVVGSEGEGPQEYLQPDAVWPLPGDSTLLVDLGNGRLVTLGPDLAFGETTPIATGDPRPGGSYVLALPVAVDARGRIYTRAVGGGMGRELPDSGAVLRIDRGTRAIDTVGKIKLPERRQNVSGGAENRSIQISQIPLSPEDAWGAAPDGSIVFARSGDYSVEWRSSAGAVTRGPSNDWNLVSIGTAEKEEYVAEQGRTGGVQIRIGVSDGAVQTNLSRGAGGSRREIDQYEWPDRKPAFYGGRVVVDPMGRAWVRRHVTAGGPTTYDLFDRAGAKVATVTVGHDRLVVGFGARSVYVVSYDDLDLAYLERYGMPSV